MGSVRQIREHSGYIMKNTLVFVFGLLIIVSMFSTSNGQKGGAKAGMRGRGRGGSRGGGRRMGGNRNSDGGGGTDAFGNGSGRRACVWSLLLEEVARKASTTRAKGEETMHWNVLPQEFERSGVNI